MQDSNWELINGPHAHSIEFLNYQNQINVIEALVLFYTNSAPVTSNGCAAFPTARVLLELHRVGTLFLLESPGEYRVDYNVAVQAADGTIRYQAPPWEQVARLMDEFHDEVGRMWPTADRIDVAAYALWRINWIHPFRNGNGRTARIFAYACICLKFGVFLPGAPTVLDLIMNDRPPYEAAIRHADSTFAQTGVADLSIMKNYLAELVIHQLSSVIPIVGPDTNSEF